MAGEAPWELWNHRSMQILVLLSLGLQFFIFVFAGIRRRGDAPVRRLLLWLAYHMADYTAVYTLGHLSFHKSKTVHEHRLFTFWAPFLLLHLGGPDNITTYALQDKKLWLPHLHILVVQVMGAAYILKKNIAPSGGGWDLLQLATSLMFGLSIIKYGERTWALKCGTLESIGVSLTAHRPAFVEEVVEEVSEEEFLVQQEYSMFQMCKGVIEESYLIEKEAVEGKKEYTSKTMDTVWELKCGTLDSIGVSLNTHPPTIIEFVLDSSSTSPKHVNPQDEASEKEFRHEEFLVRRAHSLFHICKRAMVDSSVVEKDAVEGDEEYTVKQMDRVEMWALMEIELTLMYDILYTKAAVVHTYFGYLLRVTSPLITVASLLQFKFTNKYGHSKVDVVITYVLLGGTLFMETMSLVNALGSSWTFAFLSTTRWRWLKHTALCNRRWDKLRRLVLTLHHIVKGGAATGSRYRSQRWSYTIGQYNMLHYCTRPAYTPLTSPLLGRLAKMVGRTEWWDRKHYTGTVKLSAPLKRYISVYMLRLYDKGEFNTGMLRKKWGEDPLFRRGLYKEGILKETLGVEFQEAIIIWHIGTDLFLAKSKRSKAKDVLGYVEVITVISDYMMFLFVHRPYMLPGLPQKKLYQRMCEDLDSMRAPLSRNRLHTGMFKNLFHVQDAPGSGSCCRPVEIKALANNLYDEYENRELSYSSHRLTHVARLAKQLLEVERDGTGDVLELVRDVWIDILVYASKTCSRNSHAQKLSSGGEMTTILWLMAEHLYQASL